MALTKSSFSMTKGAPLNVRDFGAVGDGVTDDTAAFESAMDLLTQYSSLYIPAGNYVLNSDNFTGSALTIDVDNVSITGAGPYVTKLTLTGTSEKGIFYSDNKSNILISGIEFVGNNVSTGFTSGGTAIWFNYSDSGAAAGHGNVAVDNCVFSEFKGPYWCVAHNQRTATTYPVSNVRFSNLRCFGGSDRSPATIGVAARQVGVHCVDGGKVQNILAENIFCDASDVKVGIGFQTAGGSELIDNIRVANCTVKNAGANNANTDVGRYGLMFYFETSNVVVDGCVFENCKDTGIYCVNGASIQVSGCTFKDCDGTVDTTLVKGALAISATDNVNITGNTFIDNEFHIQTTPAVGGKQSTVISGNTFTVEDGTSQGSIKIRNGIGTSTADSTLPLISGNMFTNSRISFFDGTADAQQSFGGVITGNTFNATSASFNSNFIAASSYQKIDYLTVSNNKFIIVAAGVVTAGLLGRGGPEFDDSFIVENNHFVGSPSGSWVDLQGVHNLKLANNVFEDLTSGYCLTTYNCRGDVFDNCFKNVTLSNILESVAGTGLDLGRAAPTYTGEWNKRVQVLVSTVSNGYAEWVWDTSGTPAWDLVSKV